jgi:predicted nucleic acid-binding protein
VRAFVDTSALVVLLDRDDARHRRAGELWSRGLREGATFWSTNYVIIETAATVQRRFGHSGLRTFFADVVPALSIEWVAPDDHERGLDLFLAERRRRLSWVDCVSFVVMRRLRLTTCFAFDRHFAEQGFEVLPAT